MSSARLRLILICGAAAVLAGCDSSLGDKLQAMQVQIQASAIAAENAKHAADDNVYASIRRTQPASDEPASDSPSLDQQTGAPDENAEPGPAPAPAPAPAASTDASGQ
jgi:hypothetical protein